MLKYSLKNDYDYKTLVVNILVDCVFFLIKDLGSFKKTVVTSNYWYSLNWNILKFHGILQKTKIYKISTFISKLCVTSLILIIRANFFYKNKKYRLYNKSYFYYFSSIK